SGSTLLSADAWQHARRPPLRAAFEAAARDERAAAAIEHRAVPLDPEASMTIEGTLRGDAAPTASGVSLAVDVDRVEGAQGSSRPSGGVIVTVVGALAGDHVDDWRAGRRVRMPAQLRRPARYLNPGVPDNERMLALRGSTLVGTVKSGALVEVVARAGWWGEALAASRAFSRRAIADAVGWWSAQWAAMVSAIVIGDRSHLDT